HRPGLGPTSSAGPPTASEPSGGTTRARLEQVCVAVHKAGPYRPAGTVNSPPRPQRRRRRSLEDTDDAVSGHGDRAGLYHVALVIDCDEYTAGEQQIDRDRA